MRGNATPTVGNSTSGTTGGSTGLTSPTAAIATRPAGTAGVAGSAVVGSPVAADGRLVSPQQGVPDAVTKVPTSFPTSYNGTPSKGGKVTAFTISYNAPPVARDQNKFWQELEKRLGCSWDPIITPQPSYGEKSSALLAGGSLPELFYLNPGQNAAPQYKAMEQGAFLDLTPYVTGDAGKEYKNLATIPASTWKNTSFKGKIYGVPRSLQRSGNITFYRSDWTKKLNIAAPTSTEAVRAMLSAFSKNDPDGNGQPDTWGITRYGGGWSGWDTSSIAFNMFGMPAGWRVNKDGTMTNEIETDEYRQGLAYLQQLFADGSFYPDAGSMTFAQASTSFSGGKVGVHSGGFESFITPKAKGSAYGNLVQSNPQAEIAGLLPSAIGGAKGVTRNTQGAFGVVGIPSTTKDQNRIKGLLWILDYLAAPFGSEEHKFLNYGIEGVDSDKDPETGALSVTNQGVAERGDLVYMMTGLLVVYYPNAPGAAEAAQKLALDIFKIGQDDPSWPLYSQTNVSKSAELGQFGFDRATAIITGREPLSTLDKAITDWKSRGGDQIRQEFEASLKGQ